MDTQQCCAFPFLALYKCYCGLQIMPPSRCPHPNACLWKCLSYSSNRKLIVTYEKRLKRRNVLRQGKRVTMYCRTSYKQNVHKCFWGKTVRNQGDYTPENNQVSYLSGRILVIFSYISFKGDNKETTL